MARRRSDIVDAGVPGVYHCISRCVRRESLLDEPGRRAWIVKRLQFLASWMAVDVISYAVMRNHIHLLLAIRPDVVAGWSDREVAFRRASIQQNQRVRRQNGIPADAPPTEVELDAMTSSRSAVLRARQELCSLGFFHRLLKEPCARLWNRQDRVTGHFWEGRFKSPRVLDLTGLIQVARYIELNEVHAGAALAVEDSLWTSASAQWRRVVAAVRDGSRDGRGAVTAESLAERILREEWRPAFPCWTGWKGDRDRPRRGRDQSASEPVNWAGAALGLPHSTIKLAIHIDNLHLAGRFARRDKPGRIRDDRRSPIASAISAGLEDSSKRRHVGSRRHGRSTTCTVALADECFRAILAGARRQSCESDVVRDHAGFGIVATSRGTCYGTPEAVAKEATRRGRGWLWGGLVSTLPPKDAA